MERNTNKVLSAYNQRNKSAVFDWGILKSHYHCSHILAHEAMFYEIRKYV